MCNQPASCHGQLLQIVMASIFAVASLTGRTATAAVEEPNEPASSAETAAISKNPSSNVELEQYIGLFKGNARAASSQVTATFSCLFCTTTSASANIQPDKGDSGGIRWGFWWEYLGFAMEYVVTHMNNTNSTNVPQMSVGYQSVSFIPMARVPILKTESMPGGRLNLYGGFGFSDILSGNIDVTIPPNPPISGSAKGTAGTIVLLGISLRFPKSMFFVEWRAADLKLSSDNWAPANSATVPINTNETVLGVAYRF